MTRKYPCKKRKSDQQKAPCSNMTGFLNITNTPASAARQTRQAARAHPPMPLQPRSGAKHVSTHLLFFEFCHLSQSLSRIKAGALGGCPPSRFGKAPYTGILESANCPSFPAGHLMPAGLRKMKKNVTTKKQSITGLAGWRQQDSYFSSFATVLPVCRTGKDWLAGWAAFAAIPRVCRTWHEWQGSFSVSPFFAFFAPGCLQRQGIRSDRILLTASSTEGTCHEKEAQPTQTLSSFFTGVAQKFRLRGTGGVTMRVHSLSLHPHTDGFKVNNACSTFTQGVLPMGCETNRKHADHNKKQCVHPVCGTEECVLC